MTQQPIAVFLEDEPIGALYPHGVATVFRYHQNASRYLSLAMQDLTAQYRSPDSTSPRLLLLPPFFENRLPLGRLRTSLCRQYGIDERDELSLLRHLAPLGSVAFQASEPPVRAPLPAERFRRQIGEYEVRLDPDLIRPQRFAARPIQTLSGAGSQMKRLVVVDDTGYIRPPREDEAWTHILKLPAIAYPAICENEYLMMRALATAGLRVADTMLVHHADQGYLLSARFDVDPNGIRLQQEDLLSALGRRSDSMYTTGIDTCIQWLQQEGIGCDTLIEQYVMAYALGNGDLHIKNLSLHYSQTMKPVFTPVYDVVCTVPYDILQMAVPLHEGYGTGWDEDDLEQIHEIACCEIPLQTLWRRAHTALDFVVENAAVIRPPEVRARILAHCEDSLRRVRAKAIELRHAH